MQSIDRHRQATRFFKFEFASTRRRRWQMRDDCRTQLLRARPGCQGPGFGIKFVNLLIDWVTGMCYAMGFVKLKYKRDTRDKILCGCAFATFPCILNAMNGRNHSLHATTFLGMRRFRVLTYINMKWKYLLQIRSPLWDIYIFNWETNFENIAI